MSESHTVSLTIHGLYDEKQEAVGLDAKKSEAFEHGNHTKAKIEVLAALTAKANAIAADVIAEWDAPEERKKALFDHYAALKENMLDDMLNQQAHGGEAED